MAGKFVWQLTVLELSGCAAAVSCFVFVFKDGIPQDIKIILGFRTWKMFCGTLALVLTQFGEQ